VLYIIRSRIGDKSCADSSGAEPVECDQDRILNPDQTQFESAPPTFACRMNAIVIDAGVNRVSDHLHDFESVLHVAETSAEDIVIVVKALPLVGGDTKDFRYR
jgi:hypothetical protein